MAKSILKFGLVFCLAVGYGCLSRKIIFAEQAQYEKMRQMEAGERQAHAPSGFTERSQVRYAAEDLPDPFQDPTKDRIEKGAAAEEAEPQELKELKVQGIIWGGKFPQAIINGAVVKTGDKISGAEVQEIGQNGVTLLFGGRQINLPAPSAAPLSANSQDTPR